MKLCGCRFSISNLFVVASRIVVKCSNASTLVTLCCVVSSVTYKASRVSADEKISFEMASYKEPANNRVVSLIMSNLKNILNQC